MSKYTVQDIINLVEEEDVEFIRLQFVDLFGNFKNMAVTTSQLDKVLNNQCMFDCAAIEGFHGVDRPELMLYPDLDTFEIFPWRPQQGKVARLICDVYKPDGTPFDGDSRYILKQVVKKAERMGYTFDVGHECEFFLFNFDEQGGATINTSEHGRYFDIGPIDAGENARRDIVLTLEDMGFEIESSFHADAPAQHEVDFRHDSPVIAADNLETFKLVVRTVARRHGLHATFMPKPKTGVKGSGMRINFSMYQEGMDAFCNEDHSGLSEIGKSFIAGILAHVRGMSVITNPIVNSYKRLVPGYEAPVYIGWSNHKQNPLVRSAKYADGTTKIELRSPDGASNPYLALAVCIAAGLDGIERKLSAPSSISMDLSRMTEEEIREQGIQLLPSTLQEAMEAFEQDIYIKNVLGSHIAETYLQAKKDEWKQYCLQVCSWELDQYLNRI